jgi:hypothetical protein
MSNSTPLLRAVSDDALVKQIRNRFADAAQEIEAYAVEHSQDAEEGKALVAKTLRELRTASPVSQSVGNATIVSIEDFTALDEPGAKALLGSDDNALVAEGSDALVTGNGGAGKTTLTTDMACHLAAGDAWLGMPVARPLHVLLIENEGPRPLFRKKLKRKLAAWDGGALEGRLSVVERPWGEFSFGNDAGRESLARTLADGQIDVLVAGPITRLGMEEAGTLQQTRDFMALVGDVRTKAGRPLAIVLVHHDNKAGNVSGAWEGTGDTLIHLKTHAPGHTDMVIEKARWAPEQHGRTLKLDWAHGEGFEAVDERNYLAELEMLLSDGYPRTTEEMAHKREHDELPGIGAGRKKIEEVLENGLALDRIYELTHEEAAGRREKVGAKGHYYSVAAVNESNE